MAAGCAMMGPWARSMVVCAVLLGMCAAVGSSARPNVLWVVVDDLGFDDVGFRSHEIRTPTVDSLKENGIVLNRYYVQDVCSPSRSTFMTGRYAMHTSIVDWIPPESAYGLPLNETTIAEVLKEGGYLTHAIGKWYVVCGDPHNIICAIHPLNPTHRHLGFYRERMTPTFRGFDSFVGFYSGGEDYYEHNSGSAYDFRRDARPNCGYGCSEVAWDAKGNYSTTLFSEAAVQVVNVHDTSKPLFLYLAYQAVHAPAEVPASYEDAYNDTIADPKRRRFAGMLSCMDEGLGNVTAALKQRGLWDNTIIIFTADNGGPTTTGDGVGARNWPLRGGKHSIFEGGVRATALIHAPNLLKSVDTEYPNLMHGCDWFPTLCEAVGVATNGTLPLDGVSHWQALVNGAGAAPPPRTEVVIGNATDTCHDCGFGLLSGDWKLLRRGGGIPDGWLAPQAVGAHIGGACEVKFNVGSGAKNVRVAQNATLALCCQACEATPACAMFVFVNQTRTCYLKATTDELHTAAGVTLGVPPGKPFPPTPAPPTPAADMLFNVAADPGEHEEVSAANPLIVQRLGQQMDAVLASYTAAKEDPDCPFKGWNKTKDGHAFLGPWCY